MKTRRFQRVQWAIDSREMLYSPSEVNMIANVELSKPALRQSGDGGAAGR